MHLSVCLHFHGVQALLNPFLADSYETKILRVLLILSCLRAVCFDGSAVLNLKSIVGKGR